MFVPILFGVSFGYLSFMIVCHRLMMSSHVCIYDGSIYVYRISVASFVRMWYCFPSVASYLVMIVIIAACSVVTVIWNRCQTHRRVADFPAKEWRERDHVTLAILESSIYVDVECDERSSKQIFLDARSCVDIAGCLSYIGVYVSFTWCLDHIFGVLLCDHHFGCVDHDISCVVILTWSMILLCVFGNDFLVHAPFSFHFCSRVIVCAGVNVNMNRDDDMIVALIRTTISDNYGCDHVSEPPPPQREQQRQHSNTTLQTTDASCHVPPQSALLFNQTAHHADDHADATTHHAQWSIAPSFHWYQPCSVIIRHQRRFSDVTD